MYAKCLTQSSLMFGKVAGMLWGDFLSLNVAM